MQTWLVNLDAKEPTWARDGALTEEERRRGAEFADTLLARRFLRSRLTVRHLLGERLSVPPAELHIAYHPGGKPYLPDHAGLQISWSRSESLLLLGASSSGPIGVDIERQRPVPTPLDVLATVYPALPAAVGPESFLPAWTLLEAAVKATGRGLSRGARDVDLVFDVMGAVALRGIRGRGLGAWSGRTGVLPAQGGTPAAVVAVVVQGEMVGSCLSSVKVRP
ncbi:4'-phosphopantetheinyl transferase family protein [Streptomyces halobius]|uniref:Phosphopantetheinyl transferase-like protein n=1 Tax=Streptomyces halobius TaxID=2879846 RepID=A0ABY4M362_9ACTN|nr:4'-phosphopantetheinyl transferase superfamily protein [Streptomyces halobius]UQA92160.1 phosphopantetheinyl transferase-like protein [Streptomyces halobius]